MNRFSIGKTTTYISVLLVACLLIFVACAEVDPENAAPQPAPEPVLEEEDNNDDELRTEEVFNMEKYEDLFTVRYFHLKDSQHAGDSILITTPDGKTMLIDAGSPRVDLQLVQYLQKLGLKSIDVALNTHPHYDHIGGFPLVLKAFDVKKFYLENVYNDRYYYHDTMNEIKKQKIDYEYLEEGKSFQLGKDVTVEVYSPDQGTLPEAAANLPEESLINYFSLVFKVTYKDTSFLFNGDIFTDREMELVNDERRGKLLDADMVHAPHHGADSSSSPAFIHAVSPQISVMSSNIFRIPVMNRYEKAGADVYVTHLHGNILITSDGETLDVITEKDWVNPMKPAN